MRRDYLIAIIIILLGGILGDTTDLYILSMILVLGGIVYLLIQYLD